MDARPMGDYLGAFADRGMVSFEPIEAAVNLAECEADMWPAICEAGNLTDIRSFCGMNHVERRSRPWQPGPCSLLTLPSLPAR